MYLVFYLNTSFWAFDPTLEIILPEIMSKFISRAYCSSWKFSTMFIQRRLRQISAYNVSTVRDSEKKFNCDEKEVDHGLSNEL